MQFKRYLTPANVSILIGILIVLAFPLVRYLDKDETKVVNGITEKATRQPEVTEDPTLVIESVRVKLKDLLSPDIWYCDIAYSHEVMHRDPLSLNAKRLYKGLEENGRVTIGTNTDIKPINYYDFNVTDVHFNMDSTGIVAVCNGGSDCILMYPGNLQGGLLEPVHVRSVKLKNRPNEIALKLLNKYKKAVEQTLLGE